MSTHPVVEGPAQDISVSVAGDLLEARAPGHEAAVTVLEEEGQTPSLGVEVVQDIVPKPIQ